MRTIQSDLFGGAPVATDRKATQQGLALDLTPPPRPVADDPQVAALAARVASARGWRFQGLARRALLVGEAWVATYTDGMGRERLLTVDDLRAETTGDDGRVGL